MQNCRSQQFKNVFKTFPSDFLDLAKWVLVLVSPKIGQKGWSLMYGVKSLLDTNLVSLYVYFRDREFSGLSLNHQGLTWVRVTLYLTSRQPWFKKSLLQLCFHSYFPTGSLNSIGYIVWYFHFFANEGDIVQLYSYKHCITQKVLLGFLHF